MGSSLQEEVSFLCQQAGMKAGTGTMARWVEEDYDVTNVNLVISDIKTILRLREIQMVTPRMLLRWLQSLLDLM